MCSMAWSPMSPEEEARATRLTEGLHAGGLDFVVESRGTLAVLTPRSGVPGKLSYDERNAMLKLSREAGYSHAALELIPR